MTEAGKLSATMAARLPTEYERVMQREGPVIDRNQLLTDPGSSRVRLLCSRLPRRNPTGTSIWLAGSNRISAGEGVTWEDVF